MLDFIPDLTGALYSALMAFAISAQALAPILPWQASAALSGVLAGVAGVGTWAFIRIFRRH